MRQETVLTQLIDWANAQPDIRAMLLTSTRALPGASTDRYSDYDVILITTDVAARHADRSWQRAFGQVVIAYQDPLEQDPESGAQMTGAIVYYPGTLKIDFTLWSIDNARWLSSQDHLPIELDAGYQLLLDKDNLCAEWPKATGVGYQRQLTDAATYQRLINDFFIGVPYVITALIRGEMLPARWVLDYDMRYEYLLPMLEWYALLNHDAPSIGAHGKGLQRYLPASKWQQLERTWVGADPEATREALHVMIELFRDAAVAVGNAIGAEYPQQLHDRVLAHCAQLEAMR